MYNLHRDKTWSQKNDKLKLLATENSYNIVDNSIISRKLDIDCINFGFSGNGRMEQPIAELISEIDPLFYIIECMPNMYPANNVTNNTIPLVNKIREKNSNAPIIFVELIICSMKMNKFVEQNQ